jgi:hypothetical protein
MACLKIQFCGDCPKKQLIQNIETNSAAHRCELGIESIAVFWAELTRVFRARNNPFGILKQLPRRGAAYSKLGRST